MVNLGLELDDDVAAGCITCGQSERGSERLGAGSDPAGSAGGAARPRSDAGPGGVNAPETG